MTFAKDCSPLCRTCSALTLIGYICISENEQESLAPFAFAQTLDIRRKKM
jgi:hypothetical protein